MMAIYVALIIQEGNNSLIGVLPWVVLMGVGAVAALAAAVTRQERLARRLLLGAAALFLVIGFLSIFSIGSGFLVAAVLAGIGGVKLSAGIRD